MTCKDCIHEKVCDALIKRGCPWLEEKYSADKFCMYFKNKEDVVEVVRCKDCINYKDWGDGNITCRFWTDQWDAATEPNAYCSYGKKVE